MSVIRYSVKNPIIVNMLMVAILILGAISFFELPRELNPKVVFNYVFIVVPYPGVGAEEIEKLITVKIEDAVDDIDDIKMMSSESVEGSAFVWVQFEDISAGTFQERLNEVETVVNRIDLPDGTLDPIVDDFDTDDFIPVIAVSIVGDIAERKLHDLAKDLNDEIIDLDGIAQAALTGTREREIWIEVDQEKLHQHRLSLGQVVASIRSRNLNIPAGDLVIGRESYLVRTIGEVKSSKGFERIVVRWSPTGNHLYLGEIASVEDRWAEESSRARIDGANSATISVSKSANANSLEVISSVKEVAEQYRNRLPLGTKLVFTYDTSIYIRDILNKLQTNALLGFILVMLILYAFMGLRNAMVAAIGIPISFMATFIFMNQTGQTFNGSSLFGLILILGVVVDDAIIVVENCFRHRQRGLGRREAAIYGATEVLWPVISATLTTIAAFLPLILMTGVMGKFMRVVPIVVSLTLLASMIEVFLIAPSHFTEWGSKGIPELSGWFKKLRRLYTRLLIRIIRKRYLVGPGVLVLAILASGVISLVGVELFHGDEFSQVMIWVTMPAGTPLEETDKAIQEFERVARNLPEKEVHTVIANTGIQQTEADWIFADHVGQVNVDLVEKEFRDRSIDEIINDLRSNTAGIVGPIDVKITKMSGGPPTGKAVEIKVKGKYIDELTVVAEEVKTALSSIPGATDIGDDYYAGKREIQVVVDEERASIYGLTVASIAQEVRTAVVGVEASIFRDGDEEVDVRVKLAGIKEGGVDRLRGLNIATPTGAMIRLDQVCRFETAPTLFRIRRFEKERAITVSANVDRSITTPVAVNKEIARRFKDIAVRHPGYKLDFRGEFKEFQESFKQLGKLFLFGVILIFTILGAQFKSVRQAFIILLTIPFAFIGSMFGLFFTGSPLSILTMYGMVALAGIAVNDAIVMIAFINNARVRGAGRWRSIIQSGRIRFRPVILTSMTTILGLLPMAVGLGGKSESWAPLANTIVWGLIVATSMTLLVIPTVYAIIVDEWFGFVLFKRKYLGK